VPTLAAGKSETGLQRGVVCHGQLAGNSIVQFWMQVSGCSLRPALRPYAEMYISSDSDIRDLRFASPTAAAGNWVSTGGFVVAIPSKCTPAIDQQQSSQAAVQ